MALILGFSESQSPTLIPAIPAERSLLEYVLGYLELRGHATVGFSLDRAANPDCFTVAEEETDARALGALCDGIILAVGADVAHASLTQLQAYVGEENSERPTLLLAVASDTPSPRSHPGARSNTITVPTDSIERHDCGVVLDPAVEQQIDAALNHLFAATQTP